MAIIISVKQLGKTLRPNMTKHKFIILGDLHFEKKTTPIVLNAFEQLKSLNPEFMVSLGDLGGYSHPGTQLSFDEAKDLFSQLNFPVYPLVGNHDLEGLEFKTDQDNLNAWQNSFHLKSPYYSFQQDDAVFVFLSTTRFRDNPYCCHEVYIDDEQFSWFESTIKTNHNKRIFVFSHAPILGSGIRVLQNLHLRGGNAWLNHSQNPGKFIALVNNAGNIHFWGSGHNHLSQEYPDAISLKNNCLFCHTGVINNITRDGRHQSRMIEYDQNEILIYTIDHDANSTKLVQKYNVKSKKTENYCQFQEVTNKQFVAPPPYETISFTTNIKNHQFTITNNMIVEYLKNSQGPIGVLLDNVTPDTKMIVNGNALEIWEQNQLIHSFLPNSLGTYSTPVGIKIQEHPLGQQTI